MRVKGDKILRSRKLVRAVCTEQSRSKDCCATLRQAQDEQNKINY